MILLLVGGDANKGNDGGKVLPSSEVAIERNSYFSNENSFYLLQP
jgi:hypothetical protein